MTLKVEDRQNILETVEIEPRIERILALMGAEIDLFQVEKRIRGRVKKQMEKSQREYYLNEQMKAIQKELGDLEDAPNETDDLKQRVDDAGMSKEAREKALTELNKLKMMSPMSAEATVVRSYLDWMLSVPWKKRSRVRRDLAQAEQILNEDHYGLEEVKERILEYLAVQGRVQRIKGPVLCLVGPPGVGKTSLGESIARATNRKFVRMALGGVRDEAEIRGHRRTYIGSMPGKVLQKMAKGGVRNPLFLFDEVDKMGMDHARRSGVGVARSARSGAEQHVQRPLSRGGLRPLRRVLHLHVELDEHSARVAGSNGSHSAARLHRRRKTQHREALSRAEATPSERARRCDDLRDRRRCDPASRPLLHA